MDTLPELYHGFIDHLIEKSAVLAPLQLSGKLESYLVLEFIRYVHKETKGQFRSYTNIGKTSLKERRIDIVVVHRAPEKSELYKKRIQFPDEEILYAIEAKYINNKHRTQKGNQANDNIKRALNELSEQMKSGLKETHGDYTVSPRANEDGIYGLIFASYVRESGVDKDNKDDYYNNKIIKKGREFKLGSYGKEPDPELQLQNLYDDVVVDSMGSKFLVTLKTGLWRITGP